MRLGHVRLWTWIALLTPNTTWVINWKQGICGDKANSAGAGLGGVWFRPPRQMAAFQPYLASSQAVSSLSCLSGSERITPIGWGYTPRMTHRHVNQIFYLYLPLFILIEEMHSYWISFFLNNFLSYSQKDNNTSDLSLTITDFYTFTHLWVQLTLEGYISFASFDLLPSN